MHPLGRATRPVVIAPTREHDGRSGASSHVGADFGQALGSRGRRRGSGRMVYFACGSTGDRGRGTSSGVLLAGDLAHFGARDARRHAWLRLRASGAAESPLETVTRVGLAAAGFAFAEQVVVPHVGRLDFVVEETVAVEADGWAFHGGREAFEGDRARDRSMLALGIPVMRFTAREIRTDLQSVVLQIASVVGRAPRRDFERRLAWALGQKV